MKLRPWHWLTEGKIYEEHINSMLAQDHMFYDAQRMESEHESKKQKAKDGETHSKGF